MPERRNPPGGFSPSCSPADDSRTSERRYAAPGRGFDERRVIPLRLSGVRESEFDHRFVQLLPVAEVAGEQPRVEAAAVRPSQQRPEEPAVVVDLVLLELGCVDAALHVAELANEEVATIDAGPAEQRVAGGLHQLLSGDGPLSLVPIGLRRADPTTDRRGPGLLDLQHQWIVLAVAVQQDDIGAQTDASEATDPQR